MRLTATRWLTVVAVFALLAAAAALVALTIGSSHVDLREALAAFSDPARRDDSAAFQILFRQRLPRIILGLLVGGALGLAGTAFQAILRNPLADPYTLGVASGSAVGAVMAISFGHQLAIGPFSSVQVASLAGAAGITWLIYRLGVRERVLRMEALLLAGVTVALVASSAILLVRTLVDPMHLVAIDRWMMGGLAVIGLREVAAVLPLMLPGSVILAMLAPAFNQLAFGEELAHGRGVDPDLVQKVGFVAGSVLTAAAVSVSGPIGFVGLIVPHAVRRLVGPDHRLLLPAAMLAAAGFLVLCDALARWLLAPTELPVGVVTAVVGGPVFVGLLWRETGRRR